MVERGFDAAACHCRDGVRSIHAMIFDLDGVLIDSEPLWDTVRRDLTLSWGGHWHDKAHRDMMGMSAPEWSRYMHERLALPQSPDEINAEVMRRMAGRYASRVPLLAGAVACVNMLAAHWPLALASSSNRALIDVVLAQAGLKRCFRVVLSSEEVQRGKPAPDVYLEVARRLAVLPGQCVAVEDSSNGIRAAAAAHMLVVAVPNSHYPPNDDALKLADAVVPSLEEVTPERVRRLNADRR
jgi:HAD superfamily hydrolase (TIGR01509 family)